MSTVAEIEQRDQPRTRPLEILLVFAHHPTALQTFLPWASTLALEGVLPKPDAELLALRTAWNCRSEFEWGHHVDYARAAGLTDDEIARIPHGADVEGWTSRQQALLRAADQLHDNTDIDDAAWAALREHLDEAQLVEVALVVGQYTMLSMVANSCGVELEAGHDRLP